MRVLPLAVVLSCLPLACGIGSFGGPGDGSASDGTNAPAANAGGAASGPAGGTGTTATGTEPPKTGSPTPSNNGPQWVHTAQDGAEGGETAGVQISVDTAGNVYVAGYTTAGIDGQTQHGNYDLFVTKYDASGARQWTVQNGAAGGNVAGYGVAVDSAGNVYVTGSTTVALDGQTQLGAQDFFVSKYSASGMHLWTVQDGAAGGNTAAFTLKADSAGNVYVTGSTTVAIDGQTQHGISDLFVTKYDSNGVRQWTVQDGAAGGNTYGEGLSLDAQGHVHVTGGTDVAIDEQTQHGSNDLFISRYDSSGVRQWTVQDGAAGGQTRSEGVSVDAQGNVYVVGGTDVAIDGQKKLGANDLFITKYDSSGLRQWTVQNGAAGGYTRAAGISLDASGNIYVSGTTDVAIDGQAQHGAKDLLITKYAASGALQWTVQNGIAGATSVAEGITLDTSGNVYVTGSTSGALDGQTQHGKSDLFISKYGSSGTLYSN